MKKVVLAVSLCLLFLLVGGTLHAGESWVKLLIHGHDNFSDGYNSISSYAAQAKSYGAQGVIMTDHYDLIPALPKGAESILSGLKKFSGYAQYATACDSASVSSGIPIYSGWEVSCHFNPNPKKKKKSEAHLLVIGDLATQSKTIDDNSSHYAGFKKKYQQIRIGGLPKVIEAGKSLGLTVAAHPSASMYSFDKKKATAQGIEFFNSGLNEKKDVNWMVQLLSKGQQPFVTAGCDSHYSAGLGSLPVIPYLLEHLGSETLDFANRRFTRHTLVWSNDLTPGTPFSSLKTAIGSGSTIATAYGNKVEMSPIPSNRVSNYEPTVKIRLYWPPEYNGRSSIPNTTPVQFWSNGKMVKEVFDRVIATNPYQLEYTPSSVKGRNWLFVYKPGSFVTSPIYWEDVWPPPPQVWTRFYSGTELVRLGNSKASNETSHDFVLPVASGINYSGKFNCSTIANEYRIGMILRGADIDNVLMLNGAKYILPNNTPQTNGQKFYVTINSKDVRQGVNEFTLISQWRDYADGERNYDDFEFQNIEVSSK